MNGVDSMREVGTDPRHGAELGPGLAVTTSAGVDAVCAAAAEVAPLIAGLSTAERAVMLRACADGLDAAAEEIIEVADLESAMGEPKLRGELARTTGQLRFLADVVVEGSYLDVTIDRAADGPELRRYQRPVGPVAVFAASNFPLAFSVAGGDTASALAVGCPVVVKSHPAHPNTSRVVAAVMDRALSSSGAPAGVFAVVTGLQAGRQLVQDPRIRAVAFTGSTAGGLSLTRLVAERDTPIPVYAEMGSTNPVVVTPSAFAAQGEKIIAGFASSFQLGLGQFCTKPGLLFVPADAVSQVLTQARRLLVPPGPLLTEGIRDSWQERADAWAAQTGGALTDRSGSAGNWASPQLFATTAAKLRQSATLREECFGPTALVVGYDSSQDLLTALDSVAGSLTGTLWSADADDVASSVLARLQDSCGRIVHNGWPTGVAVTWAMHHGGPYPATTSAAHTSVGAASVLRFLRPLCLQDAPSALLPPAVRDANPWDVPRRINGQRESAPAASTEGETSS